MRAIHGPACFVSDSDHRPPRWKALYRRLVAAVAPSLTDRPCVRRVRPAGSPRSRRAASETDRREHDQPVMLPYDFR